jgi:hypothetical protein
MDALNMAAINPAAARAAEPSFDPHPGRLSPRMVTALALLRESYEYAHDLDSSPWDFAIEIAALRRLKLSNSDLRWLAARGYVEHGVEVTLAGDPERSFQHPGRLLFNRKTCFVLSRSGAALAQQLAGDGRSLALSPNGAVDPPALVIAAPTAAQMPHWDRDRQELRVGGTVVRRFKIPAIAQETILAAFEESHWSARIDDPLPPDGEPRWRLQQAIEGLNRHQRPALVRFLGDGAGRGIVWEFCEAEAAGA